MVVCEVGKRLLRCDTVTASGSDAGDKQRPAPLQASQKRASMSTQCRACRRPGAGVVCYATGRSEPRRFLVILQTPGETQHFQTSAQPRCRGRTRPVAKRRREDEEQIACRKPVRKNVDTGEATVISSSLTLASAKSSSSPHPAIACRPHIACHSDRLPIELPDGSLSSV